MSDFFQNGAIATLHGLGTRSLDDLEGELLGIAKQRPMGLVLPSLYS